MLDQNNFQNPSRNIGFDLGFQTKKKTTEKQNDHFVGDKPSQNLEQNPEASTRTQFGRLDRLVEDFKK